MKGMAISRLISTFYKHTDINVCTKTFYFQKAFIVDLFLRYLFLLMKKTWYIMSIQMLERPSFEDVKGKVKELIVQAWAMFIAVFIDDHPSNVHNSDFLFQNQSKDSPNRNVFLIESKYPYWNYFFNWCDPQQLFNFIEIFIYN